MTGSGGSSRFETGGVTPPAPALQIEVVCFNFAPVQPLLSNPSAVHVAAMAARQGMCSSVPHAESWTLSEVA